MQMDIVEPGGGLAGFYLVRDANEASLNLPGGAVAVVMNSYLSIATFLSMRTMR